MNIVMFESSARYNKYEVGTCNNLIVSLEILSLFSDPIQLENISSVALRNVLEEHRRCTMFLIQ